MQAAAGRLNPQALPIEWVVRPTEPPPGTPPASTPVTARCAFTVAHGGSPGRVHGGVLALALDEVTGVAIRAAGASGMTVALEMSLRGAVPVGQPVDISARYTGGGGRKAYATGEILVDGNPVATARVIYVSERR
jgi:acyl-coenzyme A thioesterase PaaI-like protein